MYSGNIKLLYTQILEYYWRLAWYY